MIEYIKISVNYIVNPDAKIRIKVDVIVDYKLCLKKHINVKSKVQNN